jgi:hypothetical protein
MRVLAVPRSMDKSLEKRPRSFLNIRKSLILRGFIQFTRIPFYAILDK